MGGRLRSGEQKKNKRRSSKWRHGDGRGSPGLVDSATEIRMSTEKDREKDKSSNQSNKVPFASPGHKRKSGITVIHRTGAGEGLAIQLPDCNRY